MVHSYFMDSSSEDRRLPHALDPPQDVSLEDLYLRTGVMYNKIDESDWAVEGGCGKLKEIRDSRGYSYYDICEVSKKIMGDEYEPKLKSFYKEHLHTEEEIRLIEEGAGYFDVRDCEDRWIRIHVSKGDLLIVPAGIYHRFTLDSTNYVKTMRLFVGEPVWTPINRPADDNNARLKYLHNLENKFSKGIKV